MAKGSSSKTAAPAAPPQVKSAATIVSDDESEVDSLDGGVADDDSSSADSDELEDVAPKRRANGASLGGGGGPSRSGAMPQLPRYAPPNGMMALPLGTKFAESPFEWDVMASKPGVELWAIRAPADLKSSRLSSLNINMSSSGPSGSLTLKNSSYTLRSAGFPTPATADVDAEGRQPTAGPGIADAMTMDEDGGERMKFEGGAEMMGGMRLMVPRVKKEGKLFAAPLHVTRQLILVPDTALSTSASHDNPLPSLLATSALDDALDGDRSLSRAPAKRYQPTHLLKFRNFAVGSATPGPDVKAPAPTAEAIMPDNHVSEMAIEAEGEKPKKKRKSEAEREVSGKKKKAKL